MEQGTKTLLRRLLPWAISLAALAYVFGWVTDWPALLGALRDADTPLFVTIVVIDKTAFFLVWSFLQAMAVRRFVGHVSYREVLSVRGGSELVRAANGNLADAGVVVGLMQLTRASVVSIVAASTLPYLGHISALLVQATVALPFLEGGIADHGDVGALVAIGWVVVGVAFAAVRFAPSLPVVARSPVGSWLGRVRLRALAPFFYWFLAMSVLDIGFQWFATRAFGIPIPWPDIAARLPLLYVVLSVPSLGGFGPRELTWAWLFADYGSRDALIAYAFATNTIFLVLHVVIGMIYLPRALDLIGRMRRARARGEAVPEPLVTDPVE